MSSKGLGSDDDIYGDLESSIFTTGAGSTSKKDKLLIEDLRRQLKESEDQLNSYKNRNMVLEAENRTISRNFFALLKTAKLEIEKKSYIMDNLQKRLKELTLSKVQKSSLDKAQVENILTMCKEAQEKSVHNFPLEELKNVIEVTRRERRERRIKNLKKRKTLKLGNNMTFTYIYSENTCQRIDTVIPCPSPSKKIRRINL